MRLEPGSPRPAPGLRQRDLGIDLTHDPRACVAKTLTTVFTPASRALNDIAGRQFLFAPFGGPARFAASTGMPLAFEIRLPFPPALVPQPNPDEMKILMK